VLSDRRLSDLPESDASVRRGDLENASFDEVLNGSDAGPAVDGAERLVVTADDRDDDVGLGRLLQKELHKRGLDVRHVAGGDEREVGPRRGEAGVDPDERGSDGVAILCHSDSVGQPVEAASDDDRRSGHRGDERDAAPREQERPEIEAWIEQQAEK